MLPHVGLVPLFTFEFQSMGVLDAENFEIIEEPTEAVGEAKVADRIGHRGMRTCGLTLINDD
jgi:hypothetical protein